MPQTDQPVTILFPGRPIGMKAPEGVTPSAGACEICAADVLYDRDAYEKLERSMTEAGWNVILLCQGCYAKQTKCIPVGAKQPFSR